MEGRLRERAGGNRGDGTMEGDVLDREEICNGCVSAAPIRPHGPCSCHGVSESRQQTGPPETEGDTTADERACGSCTLLPGWSACEIPEASASFTGSG